MPTTLSPVLRHVRRLADDAADLSDADLLERFATTGDESAFRRLIDRHGSFVLGVCRRLLRHEQDAEDAFQATFLVLARKAGSVRCGAALIGWLHEVAYRAALRSRAQAVRQQGRERQMEMTTLDDPAAEAARRELRAVIDDELSRLPAKYRLPLLCHLQGKTHDETARELGWTKGTVSGRLSRAREVLRGRLSRRGLAPPAVSITLLAEEARATVSPALNESTLRAALLFAADRGAAGALTPAVVALAEGVMRAIAGARTAFTLMTWVVLGAVGAGAAAFLHQAQSSEPPAAKSADDALGTNARAVKEDTEISGLVRQLGKAGFRHGHQVHGVAFLPDGARLVSAGWDHLARLWDVGTGRQVRSFGEQAERMNPLHPSRWVYSVAVSPDGNVLATGLHASGWKGQTVTLWDMAKGTKLVELNGQQEGIVALGFAPDGKYLAVGGENGSVGVWDVPGRTALHQLPAGTDRVRAVGFTNHGRYVTACCGDRKVRFWERDTGAEVQPKDVPCESIDTLACSPDGKTLALGQGKQLHLWDIVAGKSLQRVEAHGSEIRALAFSADGKHLASVADQGRVKLWEVATAKELGWFQNCTGPEQAVAVANGGRYVAVTDPRSLRVRVWDMNERKEIGPAVGHAGPVRVLSYAGAGQVISSAGRDRVLRRWAGDTGQEALAIPANHGTDHAVAFSADGRTAIYGDAEGKLHILDWTTGRETQSIQAHQKPIQAVALWADGRRLASSSDDGTVRVWERATLKELAQLPITTGPVYYLAFSDDGGLLAWGGGEEGVHLQDLNSGKELHRLTPPRTQALSLTLSPDGRLLAAGTSGGQVYVWETAKGTVVRELVGHPGYVMALAFSTDCRSIAVGSWRSVRIWEVASGQERARFEGMESDQMAIAMAPDGRSVSSGAGDGAVLILDLTGRGRGAGRPEPTEVELTALWADLQSDDAARAHRASWSLAAVPGKSLPLVRAALRPVAPADERKIEKYIRDLDHPRFTVRENGARELERLGTPARKALRAALASSSVEVQQRAQAILDKIEAGILGKDWVTRLRLLELAERLDTPDARRLLDELAAGEPEAELTRQAKMAVARCRAGTDMRR